MPENMLTYFIVVSFLELVVTGRGARLLAQCVEHVLQGMNAFGNVRRHHALPCVLLS